MIITTAEFQNDLNKYISMVASEDIFLTQEGKTVAVVVKPEKSAVDSLRGLLKGAPDNLDIKEERLSRYENNDRH